LGKNALGITKTNNMGYKMNGWSGYQASPLTKKIPTGKTDSKGRPISTKEDAPQEHPGHGNPKTPDNLYKADGTKVNVANIDEGELSGDKTDDKGRYTLYAPEGQEAIKYYYKNPK